MKYLKSYKLYKVNEIVGIAEATTIYDDILLSEFNKHLDQFLSSKIKEKSYKKLLKKEDLVKIITNNNWPKFPVSEIEIEFKFEITPIEEFKKKYYRTIEYKNWVTYGACYNLEEYDPIDPATYLLPSVDDRADKTIHLRMEIGAELSSEFVDKEGLEVEIESCITHELNHAYEGWVRSKTSHGQVSVDLTYSLDVNRPNIKKELFKVWNDDINIMLYWSERHELNAMTQEAWPYVKKYDFNEMKKKCPVWKAAEQMIYFKTSEFKKEFIEKARSIYPDMSDYEIEFIFKSLKGGLSNHLNELRIKSEQKLEDKPSITGDKIKAMSLERFFKFAEKRINIAGQKLKNRIIKLYSLK